MSVTFPSWAHIGARCVLVDAGPGDVDGPHDAKAGDICVIDALRIVEGVPACLCHEINGRWKLPYMTYARLSRFKPLVETDHEIEAQIYRKKIHQKAVPVKASDWKVDT